MVLLPGLLVCVQSRVEADDDWVVERFEWRGVLEMPGEARLTNLHGDLRVRPGTGDEVYVVANMQHHADDPRRPGVDVSLEGRDLRVTVGFDEENEVVTPVPAGWEKRRVDVTVLLPATTRVDAATDRGVAEVRGLSADLRVTTGTGNIAVRGSGALVAQTQHGEILAQFRREEGLGRSELATSTGPIRAELPWDVQARASIETRGEITTDYSVRIRYDGPELKRGVVGEQDRPGLVLRSYSGPIKLLRSRVPAEER